MIKLRKNRNVIFSLLGIISIILVVSLFRYKECSINEKTLNDEIASLSEDTNEIQLSDVATFSWDEAYIFAPYTSVEYIYKEIGDRWIYIQEGVSEGTNQMVFLKDGKAVCYSYGYPKENGYLIGTNPLDDDPNIHLKISSKDTNKFKVEKYNNISYLEYIK